VSETYNHDCSPEENDRGKKSARSNFADSDGCGRLEKSVRKEKDERDDRISIILRVHIQLCCHSKKLLVNPEV
jgi:hypothetical protein